MVAKYIRIKMLESIYFESKTEIVVLNNWDDNDKQKLIYIYMYLLNLYYIIIINVHIHIQL